MWPTSQVWNGSTPHLFVFSLTLSIRTGVIESFFFNLVNV